MNDPNEPTVADELMDALFAGLDPAEPLADEVERLLNETGGPVPVDEDELRTAVESVQTRIRGARRSQARSRLPRWRLAAAAIVAAGIGFAWWSSTRPADGPAPVEVAVTDLVPDAVALESNGVEIRTGSTLSVREDTVLLADGVVSVTRDEPKEGGVHRVRLTGLDVLVEPIGTIYTTGSRGDVAAVWVREGRVKLIHGTQGHLGEVGAGGWALLSAHADGGGIEVHRIEDGPFQPADVGLGDDEAAALLADMRWMALPVDTRAAIVDGTDAP